MTASAPAPAARPRSNRRLLGFLALLILPPVVLVLGPFRGRFFPKGTRAMQALAIVEPQALDVAKLAGPRWSPAEVDELHRLYESGRYAAIVERLDREPRERMTAGLKYLFGTCALLDRRSTVAAKGFADALQEGDAELRGEAGFALAQALLLTGDATAADKELARVAEGDGPHRETAARQRRELSALR